MSHICEECKCDVFTIVPHGGVKVFQCMSCGAVDSMKQKPIQVNDTQAVNTGVRRPYKEPEYKFVHHAELLRIWRNEWKKLLKTK